MASFVIYMFTVCHKTSLEMKWKTNLARSWSRLWWSKVRTSSLRLKGVELPVVRKYFDMDVSSVTVNLSAWWPIRGHSGSPHGKHFPCEDQHSTVTICFSWKKENTGSKMHHSRWCPPSDMLIWAHAGELQAAFHRSHVSRPGTKCHYHQQLQTQVLSMEDGREACLHHPSSALLFSQKCFTAISVSWSDSWKPQTHAGPEELSPAPSL